MSKRLAALLAAGACALAACGGNAGPADAPPAEEARSDAGIQLFQYPWRDVAESCPGLAEAGLSWVLLSPAQEHPVGEEWWWSYQPVSYQIKSRQGTREDFAAMVEACHAVGIEVYADAVVNHMTGIDGGTGFAGTEFTHYEYPGLYTYDDFHHCGLTPNDDISSYQDAAQVQECELVNLADLATGTPHVRETIAAYLDDLVSLGVDGFRIDAAKHMPPEDVAAILAGLPDDIVVMQEVIRASGEPIAPEQYVDHGGVFEFSFGRDIEGVVVGNSWSFFLEMGTGSRYVPDGETLVVPFVANHDTERNGSTLAAADGDDYQLANVLMLIHGYGSPMLLDSYAFSDKDAGAPAGSDGRVLAPVCGPAPVVGEDFPEYADGEFFCVQDWPQIRAALRFDAIAGADSELSFLHGERSLAVLERGGAIAVVNRGDQPYEGSVPTGLETGDYCEVAATFETGECVTVTVGDDGDAEVAVPALGIAVLTPADRP